MKFLLKTIEIIITLVLLVLFVLISSPLLPTKKYMATYIVSTGSMEPAIKTGSVAVTTNVDINSLKVGDVITFKSPLNPNDTIIHRIIEIESPDSDLISFYTKGDNNDSVDNWEVTPELLIGKTIVTLPYLGNIVNLLKTPGGFGIGIVIPAIMVIILQIFRIRKGIQEEVDKRTKAAIEKAQEKSSASTLLPALFIATGLFLGTQTSAMALFTDSLEINGIRLAVADLQTQPDLDFYSFQDQAVVGFKLDNISDYPQGEFKINYKRDQGLEEEIVGGIDNSESESQFVSPEFELASCSDAACAYHTNITDLTLTVTLLDQNAKPLILHKSGT